VYLNIEVAVDVFCVVSMKSDSRAYLLFSCNA